MAFHRIGIFDSGIGGLTIRESVISQLPGISTVYVADHAFMPYGEKTDGEIVDRAIKLIAFLRERRVQLVIVACNTATVAGIDRYRAEYPGLPIVGVVPVVKTAAQLTRSGSFAVFSTTKTNDSPYLTGLIGRFAPACRVAKVGSGKLAALIETGEGAEGELDGELERMASQVPVDADVVALGCTHYPLVTDRIRKAFRRKIAVIDSGGAVARQTKRLLETLPEADPVAAEALHEIWTTGNQSVLKRRIAALSVTDAVVKHADIP
jgi:glutamate racemase